MVAILSFAPKHCPNCGIETGLTDRDPDWRAMASHSCQECGTQYQRVETDDILKAATTAGGDLAQYVTTQT